MAGNEIKEATSDDFAGLENSFAPEAKILAQAPEPADQDFEVGQVAISAEQKADLTESILEDPNLTRVDVDKAYMLEVNTGSEGINESLYEQALAQDGVGLNDKLAENLDTDNRFSGSETDFVSDQFQAAYANEKSPHVGDAHSGVAGVEHMDFEMKMPEIHDADDLELAVQRTYEILAEAGVPDRELNQAMAAGAKNDDNYAILQEMKELADEHKVPEAQGYLNLVSQDMETLGIGGKPESAAPALAMNDLKFDQNQQMRVSGMRMG